MLTTGSKTFFGLAVPAFITAIVYAVITNGIGHGGIVNLISGNGAIDALLGPLTLGYKGGVGDHLGYAVLMGFSLTCFGFGIAAAVFRDADAKSVAEIEGVDALAPVTARPLISYWPIVASFGVGLMVVGLATQPVTFVIGLVVVIISTVEWALTAWADEISGDVTANARYRAQLLAPIEIPVAVLLGIVIVVFSFSRLLLAVSKNGSVIVAAVLAALIFGTALILGSRPQIRRSADRRDPAHRRDHHDHRRHRRGRARTAEVRGAPRRRRRAPPAHASRETPSDRRRSPPDTSGLPGRRHRSALALFVAGCSSDGHPLTTFDPQGSPAHTIQNLIVPVFIVAGIVFVLVEGAIIFFVIKFRRRSERRGRRRRAASDRTATPAPSWPGRSSPASSWPCSRSATCSTIWKLENDQVNAKTNITVVGQQWWWEFRYDVDGDGKPDIITPNQLVIPVHTMIGLQHPVERRHPLVLDPGAQRQARRGARTSQRAGHRGRQARHLRRAVHRVLRPVPRLHADAGEGADPRPTTTSWVANQLKGSVQPEAGSQAEAGQAGVLPAVRRLPPDQRLQRQGQVEAGTNRPAPTTAAPHSRDLGQRAEPHAPHEPREVRRQHVPAVRDRRRRRQATPDRRTQRRPARRVAPQPARPETDGARPEPRHAQPPTQSRTTSTSSSPS